MGYERSQTQNKEAKKCTPFESCAVYKDSETAAIGHPRCPMFESCAVYICFQSFQLLGITELWFDGYAVYTGSQ